MSDPWVPREISAKKVKAAKNHRCETCNQWAAVKGEKYVRRVLSFDGRLYTWLQCDPCRQDSLEVDSYLGDLGVEIEAFQVWAESEPHNPRVQAWQKRIEEHP